MKTLEAGLKHGAEERARKMTEHAEAAMRSMPVVVDAKTSGGGMDNVVRLFADAQNGKPR